MSPRVVTTATAGAATSTGRAGAAEPRDPHPAPPMCLTTRTQFGRSRAARGQPRVSRALVRDAPGGPAADSPRDRPRDESHRCCSTPDLVTVVDRMPPTTPAVPQSQVPQARAESGPGGMPSATAPRQPPDSEPPTESRITLRSPALSDGGHMWRLARDSGALDLNTSYAYLLFARDFADTCRVAVVDGEVVGFVLGYRRPTEPETLFVWQIAVDPSQRGKQLAGRLLTSVAAGARFVEASITADNTASQRLFERFARDQGAELTRGEFLAASDFPDGHDAEGLVRIGPLRS